MAGSHLDTQPTGGNFDGVYGVLAAFEVLEALPRTRGVTTDRPLEAVVWTNEEGARFQPTTMGSAVFAGALPLETALATTDAAGISVAAGAGAEPCSAWGFRSSGRCASPWRPILRPILNKAPSWRRTHHTLGIVSGIQGLRWFRVEVTGEEAHAGTTHGASAKMPFVAAVRMVTALQELLYDAADTVRFTVGRFEVDAEFAQHRARSRPVHHRSAPSRGSIRLIRSQLPEFQAARRESPLSPAVVGYLPVTPTRV